MTFAVADGIILADQIRFSLWVHEPAVLYWATIQQYKKKATKHRAIAIYELFVIKEGPWDGAIGESEFAEKETNRQVAARAAIKLSIQKYYAQIVEGSKKGAFSFLTAGDRKPEVDLFDDYNKLIKLEEVNGPLTEYLKSPQERKPIKAWETNASIAKKRLSDAGFDLKELGLDSVK